MVFDLDNTLLRFGVNVDWNSMRRNLVDYYLKIIRTAGASELDVNFVLPQEPDAVDSIGRLLKSHDISHDNYAVLIPGSAHIGKCWPVERFAAIADRISSQFNLDMLATGTESETGIVEKLKEKANVPVANLTGRTSLSELIVLLKKAKLVVSNDTGPGHIAAALGVPLVLIFGRVNPHRLAPYGRNQCVVAIDPDNRGSGIKSTNPKHDIKEITIEQVYKKVCEQMNDLA